MKSLTLLSLALITLITVSCGSPVSTVKADDVNLNSYSSFAYLPNTDIKLPNNNVSTDDVNTLVVETINANMKNAGYTLDRDQPDLLVLVSTKTNRETETTTDPVYATYPYRSPYGVSTYYSPYYYNNYTSYNNIVGYDTDTYTYKEGTVIVDIIDRETKKLVWKGRSEQTIYNQTNTSAMKELINAIFSEYPLTNK